MANGTGASALGGGIGALIGGSVGILGGVLAERQQRRFRRRQRGAIQSARDFADETVQRITSNELFTSASDFIKSTFQDAAGSPLAQDFAKSIRAAQSVRGTFSGNIGAAQEAVGTSGFAQQLRSSLLGQALTFAQAPELLRQRVLAQEAPLRVAAATGAPIAGLGGPPNLTSPLSSGLTGFAQGATGGFQIGSSFAASSQFDAQLEALRKSKATRTGQTGALNTLPDSLSGLSPDTLAILQQLGGLQ